MATNRAELMANAAHWLDQAKRNGLGACKIGAIFIFFNTEESGTAVCAANVPRERVKQECECIIKKGSRLIVNPYES